MTEQPDKRLNAYRADIADSRLEGKVTTKRFVEGVEKTVGVHVADLLNKPDGSLDTQVLHGHQVTVFEDKDGWSWVQNTDDGYVGYIQSANLVPPTQPTHMVLAPRTFLYPDADLKNPKTGYRSMGSKVVVVDAVTNRGTNYLILESGDAIVAHHLIELGNWKEDYVTVAETLLHTPYLWGGNTGFGIDCSGLVQLAQMLCGNTVLRDSDMQQGSIGSAMESDFDQLERGDLVFWQGHVGIMTNAETLLHANGASMNVALESLQDAIKRIGHLYGQPTAVRRPQ